MNFIYNTGLRLYLTAAKFMSPFNNKAKLFYNGRRDLISTIKERLAGNSAKIIWVHCSSVGEFEQARPLIERLRELRPELKVLLTFFSPSGYELRKNYQHADWVFYLPMDTSSNAKAFVEAVNPTAVVFIKYEFWYNYLRELKKRGIPTYIISAIFRKDQMFFRWYGSFFRKMLSAYHLMFVQDENSLNLLKSIGINNTVICGDTRFDRVHEITSNNVQIEVVEKFADGFTTLIAGSSWEPDEKLIAGYFESVQNLKLVLAPHEVSPDNIKRIETLFANYKVIRYSHLKDVKIDPRLEARLRESRILIIDTIGILSSVYRYASVAYVGGGFGVGIHNILEAATYGVPVVFGPKFQKFKEARDLVDCKGAFSIKTQLELNKVLDDLLINEENRKTAGAICGSYVKENLGATSKILSHLKIDS